MEGIIFGSFGGKPHQERVGDREIPHGKEFFDLAKEVMKDPTEKTKKEFEACCAEVGKEASRFIKKIQARCN